MTERSELVDLVQYLTRETAVEYVDVRLSRVQLEELSEILADVELLERTIGGYSVGATWTTGHPAALFDHRGASSRKILSVHNLPHGGQVRAARAIARLAGLESAPAAEGGTHVPVRR